VGIFDSMESGSMEDLMAKLAGRLAMETIAKEVEGYSPEILSTHDLDFTGLTSREAKEEWTGYVQTMFSLGDMLTEFSLIKPDGNQVILDLIKEAEDKGVMVAPFGAQLVWHRFKMYKLAVEEQSEALAAFFDGRWIPTIQVISLGGPDASVIDDTVLVLVTLTGDLSGLTLGGNWIPFR
jgi:hypothetical protein